MTRWMFRLFDRLLGFDRLLQAGRENCLLDD